MLGNRAPRGVLSIVTSVLALGAAGAVTSTASASAGDLTYAGCAANGGGNGCENVGSIVQPTGVGVSPDGRQLYVTSPAGLGITTFDRGLGGTLTFRSCLGAQPGIDWCEELPFVMPVNGIGFEDLAVDPTGAAVYVSSRDGVSAVWAMARAPDGTLSFGSCFSSAEGGDGIVCQDGDFGFEQPIGIAVSPDGGHVYVAEHQVGSVYSLDVANDLTMTQGRCWGIAPECSAPSGVGPGATDVAVSPDGASIYATTSRGDTEIGTDALLRFERLSGVFEYIDCFEETGFIGCGHPLSDSLDQAAGVAVSDDGKSVYVAAGHPTGGDNALTTFARASDGSLTEDGCLALNAHDGCQVLASSGALNGIRDVIVSPDGASVYAASPTAISQFRRAADGSLTFAGCLADNGAHGCADPGQAPLEAIREMAISPSGRSVYVTSLTSVLHFERELPGPDVPDTKAPGLATKLKKGQKLGNSVVVEVSCDEACSLEATGKLKLSGEKGKLKLKEAAANAAAGQTSKLKLKLSGATAKKVKRSDAKRGKVSVTVVATDAAGNATTTRDSAGLK